MYRGWPDRRRPRWPHWPARLRPGRLRQQVLVMRPALAAACFHAQQLRPSAQGFELARQCFGSAQRQPALACHLASPLAARRSPALDQRRAGRDARVRRDAAGGDRPRRLVHPGLPQNPPCVAGMTGLRRPDLGRHPRLRRGSNRAGTGAIGSRIALRADQDPPRPASGCPGRLVLVADIACRHGTILSDARILSNTAPAGRLEMGSSVGFSLAGRPGSIPVNARPFAAYV